MSFNWRCALGLHPWSKWGSPKEIVIHQSNYIRCDFTGSITTTEPVEWTEVRQGRVCDSCGALQSREVRKVDAA